MYKATLLLLLAISIRQELIAQPLISALTLSADSLSVKKITLKNKMEQTDTNSVPHFSFVLNGKLYSLAQQESFTYKQRIQLNGYKKTGLGIAAAIIFSNRSADTNLLENMVS